MHKTLVSFSLLAITLSGVAQAGDFPFESIVLVDGVLLVDKTTGQNWILDTAAQKPHHQRSWQMLPLPGQAARPAMPHQPQAGHSGMMSPHPMPQQMMPPGMTPPHVVPGMPPQTWQAPASGFGPPGSYSQAVPMNPPMQPQLIPVPQQPNPWSQAPYSPPMPPAHVDQPTDPSLPAPQANDDKQADKDDVEAHDDTDAKDEMDEDRQEHRHDKPKPAQDDEKPPLKEKAKKPQPKKK